jgi:hypothetical protein
MTARASILYRGVALAGVLAGSLAWPGASARATTFNFETPSGTTPSTYFTGLNMYQDWVGVNASANWANYVYQDQNGLGVVESPVVPATSDPGINNNPAEMLQLQFTKNVVLDGLTFTALDPSPGWAMIFVDSSIIWWNPLAGGNSSGTGTYYLDLTGLAMNQRMGSTVKIAAYDPVGGTDGFQIGSLAVEQVPGAPLPTGFGIGLVMFGGLALVELARRPAHRAAGCA